ncbi:TetR/AcrR family transcriptional regulator [Actinopolymorpha sp. B11F2]|uniref:TetR/AcrR family transcriptional regulator n=1 Tax=Actinopolymorpha sp. B11F2 TaxID=3160862 RepID=UPI0032E504B0
MTGRPRSVSDEAIFDAVADVVTAVGPSGLTLAAVARRAGLSAPGLTQRFGSKRALLVAFASREAAGVASIFEDARAATPGPLEAIRKALVSLPGPITTREGVANNLAFLQLDLTDPDLHRHAADLSRSLRAELTTLLEEAAKNGDVVVDRCEVLADSLYAIYCGALLTWAIDGTGELHSWLAERIDRTLAPHRRATT